MSNISSQRKPIQVKSSLCQIFQVKGSQYKLSKVFVKYFKSNEIKSSQVYPNFCKEVILACWTRAKLITLQRSLDNPPNFRVLCGLHTCRLHSVRLWHELKIKSRRDLGHTLTDGENRIIHLLSPFLTAAMKPLIQSLGWDTPSGNKSMTFISLKNLTVNWTVKYLEGLLQETPRAWCLRSTTNDLRIRKMSKESKAKKHLFRIAKVGLFRVVRTVPWFPVDPWLWLYQRESTEIWAGDSQIPRYMDLVDDNELNALKKKINK